ncbi:hypothetical protein [Geoalkalibacter halelectricus]|uniref:Nickel transport protein n=1 Tax=Geoalkalibacter halelectricus TaxID=2847045 RepID=A0ABY5ZNV6_9BACT|nr:hypothetical protein [Geoalkalibacter halelectricus]MDO3377491.1 hypothetical protein [Geoalkalibacter halelectricus]UWZ80748.1 hypothetical protein L9S41_04935 [Geoalkalibacter halelectricus]
MAHCLHLLTLALCLGFLLAGFAPNAGAASPPHQEATHGLAAEEICGETLALLQQHQQELGRELRRVHREIAALRHDLEQPGLKEIFSGIGYILGLCGVAFFFLGRRQNPGKGN